MKLTSKLTILLFILIISCKKKEVIITPNHMIVKSDKKKINKNQDKKPVKNLDSLNRKNAVNFFTEYGKQNKATKIRFKTRLGNFVIKLYTNTPLHRANFIFLTKKGYFDTTCFHRVVPNFIAQGGNSEYFTTSKFRNKYKNYYLPSEFRKNRKHKRGVIAQARDWEDNPTKKSTPFEFYITVKSEHHLDNEHTVFGEIIKGMHVIDKITKVKTGKDEWPLDDVFITAEVVE